MTEERNSRKESDTSSTNKIIVGTVAAFGAGVLVGAIGASAHKILNNQSLQQNGTMGKNGTVNNTKTTTPQNSKGGSGANSSTSTQNRPQVVQSSGPQKVQPLTSQNANVTKAPANSSQAAPNSKKVKPQNNEKKATTPTTAPSPKGSAQVPKPSQNSKNKSPSPAPSTTTRRSSSTSDQNGRVNNKYEGRSSPTPSVSSTGSVQNQKSSYCQVYRLTNANIIIAIDATKDFAGGILVLPNTQRIYFYCIKWASFFDFTKNGGGEKPDVVNAALSIEVFAHYIRHYRKLHVGTNRAEIVVKTSSKFCLENSQTSKLFSKVNTKLRDSQGKWEHVKPDDDYVSTAFKLSRGKGNLDAPASLELLTNRTNISKTHFSVLHAVAIMIPEQVVNN